MRQLNLNGDFIEEKELLIRVSTGNEKAFTQLFHQYSPKVYSYALKLVKSENLAEEIVQEVFVKIWNLGFRLVEIENLDAFLRVTTRNHTLKLLRRMALEIKTSKMMADGYDDSHNETEEYIIFKESAQILVQAIDKLPPQQKIVYQLCHQEGLKYEEAAERLNLSKLTVKTHMQHALRFLRGYIANHTDIGIVVIFLSLLTERK